jgi:hypothetical protein
MTGLCVIQGPKGLCSLRAGKPSLTFDGQILTVYSSSHVALPFVAGLQRIHRNFFPFLVKEKQEPHQPKPEIVCFTK